MISIRSSLSLTYPETIVSWTNQTTGEIEEFSFIVSVYGKVLFSTIDVYSHLNVYLRSLKVDKQKLLFDEFSYIRHLFDNVLNHRDLMQAIKASVVKIFSIASLESIEMWIKLYSDIRVPDGFEDRYIHDINNNKTLDKTYLKSDYISLMAYSISMKLMVPIWGEYMNYIRKDIGTEFREYNAFQLLAQTIIIDSNAYNKLYTYIKSTITEAEYNSYNVLVNSISNEDFAHYVFCLTCVRRVPFLDIKVIGESKDNDNFNALTSIYKFIKQRVKGPSDLAKVVKDKDKTGLGIDEDSKISVLEKYKIKTDISLEDIVELEYSVRDIHAITQMLCSTIDPNILDESLRTSSVLLHCKIPDASIRLLQWVFKPVISPRGIMYLSKTALVQLLGGLEAVLWSRGHKYLALLATCKREPSDDYVQVVSIDSRSRISDEYTEKLKALYPFSKTYKVPKTNKEDPNYVISTIDSFVSLVASDILKMTANEKMMHEVTSTNNRRFIISPDIKTLTARLFLELGERSWI